MEKLCCRPIRLWPFTLSSDHPHPAASRPPSPQGERVNPRDGLPAPSPLAGEGWGEVRHPPKQRRNRVA